MHIDQAGGPFPQVEFSGMQMLSSICERKGGGSSMEQGGQQTQCRSARGPASPTGSSAAERAAGGAPRRTGRARPSTTFLLSYWWAAPWEAHVSAPLKAHSTARQRTLPWSGIRVYRHLAALTLSACIGREVMVGVWASVCSAGFTPWCSCRGDPAGLWSGWDHSLLPAPLFMRWFRGIYGGEPSLPVTSSHSSLWGTQVRIKSGLFNRDG